jgi:hypothetical protein
MIHSGLDGVPRRPARLRPRRLAEPRGNGLIRERLAVGDDLHHPIVPFFHLHLGRSDIVAELIELLTVRHRPITAEDSCRLQAQDVVERASGWPRPTQIGGLLQAGPTSTGCRAGDRSPRTDSHAQRGDARPPQLLNQQILEGAKNRSTRRLAFGE